jgi:hypothetical protein
LSSSLVFSQIFSHLVASRLNGIVWPWISRLYRLIFRRIFRFFVNKTASVLSISNITLFAILYKIASSPAIARDLCISFIIFPKANKAISSANDKAVISDILASILLKTLLKYIINSIRDTGEPWGTSGIISRFRHVNPFIISWIWRLNRNELVYLIR